MKELNLIQTNILLDIFKKVEQEEAEYVVFTKSDKLCTSDLQEVGMITYGKLYSYYERYDGWTQTDEPYIIDDRGKINLIPFFVCDMTYFV